MYYISKERYIFTPFTGTSKSENNMKFKKMYAKKVIFDLYFSIVHISTNNVLGNLKFCEDLDYIPLEETVSQIIFFKSWSSFYVKKRVTFLFFCVYLFLKFLQNEPGPVSKIWDTVPSAVMVSMCMQNLKLLAWIIREISTFKK